LGRSIPDPGTGNDSGVFLSGAPTGTRGFQQFGGFMSRTWIALAVALALVAGAAWAAEQAKESTQAQPAPPVAAPHDKASPAKEPAKNKKKLVSLNGASKEELKALPGGSEEEATRIIAGRPYYSKAFLVTNKIVSEGRYFEIKSLVEAGALPKGAPKK
jgi:competence protein ComEA